MGLFTLLLLPFGCAPPEVSPSSNLLLITIDTLRADHLSAYGYPRPTTPKIDELAAAGVLFEEAISPRGETWPALVTILTGTPPRTHGVRGNGQELDADHETLAQHLQRAGYSTAAFLTNMTTTEHRGFDATHLWAHDTDVRRPQYELDAEATAAARSWLAENHGEPFFLWLHLVGPHEPYTPDPSLPRRYDTGYTGDLSGSRPTLTRIHRGKRELAADEVAHIVSLYDEEVSAVDVHVGELLAELDRTGVSDDTLTVFSADHGDELYDHDFYFLHSLSITRSVLRVPLILRMPATLPAGRRIESIVQSGDVAPTILSLLGRPIPSTMEGVDLSELARGTGPHPRALPVAFAELGPEIHSIQTPRWKYIHNPKRYTSPGVTGVKTGNLNFFHMRRDELYDLERDPGEHHDVAAQHPDVVEALRTRLLAWVAAEYSPAAADISPASRAELEALGYLESPGSSPMPPQAE